MNTATLFTLCQDSTCLAVLDVYGAACDNAADTLGAKFVRGNFDAAFLALWLGSVQTILASGEEVGAEAYAFFAAHNVKF